jgi:hypothetical protein
MSSILLALVIIFALATLGVLVLGVSGMVRQSDFHRRNSNRLMRLRVILQGVTLLLLVLLFASRA